MFLVMFSLALLQTCTKEQRIANIHREIVYNPVPLEKGSAKLPSSAPPVKVTIDSIHDLIELERCIRLQGKEESTIGTVIDIEWINHRFYIADGSQDAVFCFGEEGSYLYPIGHSGQGPGEYQDLFGLSSFEDQLVIFSRSGGHLLFYDLQGNFQRDLNLSTKAIYASQSSFIKGNLLYACNIGSPRRETPHHLILDISKSPFSIEYGFGVRPGHSYKRDGWRNPKFPATAVFGFANVENTIWTGPFSSSIIDVFDMQGRSLGKIRPGFDGLTQEEVDKCDTADDVRDLRSKKQAIGPILPLNPYVFVCYIPGLVKVNLYDTGGNLLKVNLDQSFIPISSGFITNNRLVIPVFFSQWNDENLLKAFGKDMQILLDAGIDPRSEESNPTLLIYKIKQP